MMTQAQVLARIAAEWDAAAKEYYGDPGRASNYNTPIYCPTCDAPYYYRGSARGDHLRWHLKQAQAQTADFWNETHAFHGLVVVPLNTTTRRANQLLAILSDRCRTTGIGYGITLPTVAFVYANLPLIRRAGFPARVYGRGASEIAGYTPFALMRFDDFKFIYDLFAALTTYDEAQSVFRDMAQRRKAPQEAA